MAYFKCKGFNGYIDVNGVANATVTATTTGRAFSAVANASGYARIKVTKKGEYTVTSTGTTRIAHATVTSGSPVTAYYIWGKYNTVHTWGYYQTGEYNYGTYRVDLLWGCYNSMSFDASSGLFTASSRGEFEPQWYYTGYYLPSSGTVYPASNLPTVWQSTEICQITRYDNWRRGGDDRAYLDIYVIKFVRNSDTYKSKGSYIGTITSTDINAYPSGYSSGDGYWYEVA